MKISLALGGWKVEVEGGQCQGLVLSIRLLVGWGAGKGLEVEALPLALEGDLSGTQGSPQVGVGGLGGPGGERTEPQAPDRVGSGGQPDPAAAGAA